MIDAKKLPEGVAVMRSPWRDEGLVTTCLVHGEFVFPIDCLVSAVACRDEHAGCAAAAGLQRRRPCRKSRRSPLVHLLPAAGPTSTDAAGKAAPGHMGVTLGFAPAARREWRSPGPVRL